jgi:hypothetical protein
MENTIVEESKTVAEKIVHVPVEVATLIVKGAEAVAQDGAHVVIQVAATVVDAAKTVVVDTAEVTKQIGRDVEHVVAPQSPVSKPTPAASVIETTA